MSFELLHFNATFFAAQGVKYVGEEGVWGLLVCT